jgi:GNAT superfamily N-acetyltransferase
MKKADVIIRPGKPDDLLQAHTLIKELAQYEKAPGEVVTDPDLLRKDMEEDWFVFFVAEYRDEIIGIAWGHRAYSTWKGRMYYLDDLVVRESYRRVGVGLLLLRAFVSHARKEGAQLIKWQVLDWNEPALRFYRKLNAKIETDWWNVKLSLSDDAL